MSSPHFFFRLTSGLLGEKDASVNRTCFILLLFAKTLPSYHPLRIIPISDVNFSSSTKGASRMRQDWAAYPAPFTLSPSSAHLSTLQKYSFFSPPFLLSDLVLAFELVRLRFTPSLNTALDSPHVVGGRGYGVGNDKHHSHRSRPEGAEVPTPLLSPLCPFLLRRGDPSTRGWEKPGRLPARPRSGAPSSLRGAGRPSAAPAAGLAPPHGARSRPLKPARRMGPDGPDSPASRHLAASFTIAPARGRRRRAGMAAAAAAALATARP